MSLEAVLHIKDRYLGLSEKWFYNYIQGFPESMTWVAFRRSQNLNLFPFGHLIPVQPYGPLEEVLRQLGGRFFKRKIWWNPDAYRDVIERVNPDVVHTHYGPMGYELIKLKREFEFPMVVTFYGSDISVLPQRHFWRVAYRDMFKYVDLVFTEGNAMRQKAIDLGCPPHKVKVVHISVDLDELLFVERGLQKSEKVVFLMCCNFKEKKGIPYALRAFSIVHAQRPSTRLKIIGDGELRRQIEEVIQKLDIQEVVKLMGYQPHPVFVREAQDAHIFLAPSVTAQNGDTEGGAPTVLIEAQAMGMPVIASRHADIPEVVRDGESGLLAGERDVQGLAQHMLYLVDHPDRWAQMGRYGREHIRSEYSISKVVQTARNNYESLV